MSNVYYVGSEPLSFEGIERILTQNMKLELSPEVKERIQRCRDYLDHKIEQQEGPLYGITTGFGSLCNKNISPDELSTLQENLVKSHACSVGDEVSPVIVRLMMLLKAHALSLGHSGVHDWCALCISCEPLGKCRGEYRFLCSDRCSRRRNFPDRRSGGIGDQTLS